MAEYCLSGFLLDLFKRHARKSFPDVKHSHLIEGFARGFGFTTHASLSAHLKTSATSSEELRDFSTEAMSLRLVELGYRRSPAWPEHFGIPDNATIAARAKVLNGRKRTYWTLDELVDQDKVRRIDAQKLKALAALRATILISGTTGSGKSTLLCALLHERAVAAAREQFVSVDSLTEFRGFPSNVTHEETPVGLSQVDSLYEAYFLSLLGTSMTLVPGEIRNSVAYVAVRNWEKHGGGLATIHAESASHALNRLTHLVETVYPHPVGCVDVVVQMGKSGLRRGIDEIRLLNHMSRTPATATT